MIPAIEYLQGQRVRAMIMRQFAAAVSRFDVYIAPYMNMRTAPAAGTGAAGSDGGGPGRGNGAGRGNGTGRGGGTPPPSAIRDHFQAANICTYPAVSVPNGFTADGRPTSITFMGQLYGEAALLALAKAYQDRAGWHLKHPDLV